MNHVSRHGLTLLLLGCAVLMWFFVVSMATGFALKDFFGVTL